MQIKHGRDFWHKSEDYCKTENLIKSVYFRIVMYKMSEKLEEIDKMRKLMKKSMKELVDNDPETFLNRAVDCHLRYSKYYLQC